MSEKKYRYSCVVKLGETNPVRIASSEEEFVEELINEYNLANEGLFDIKRSDISKIRIGEEIEEENDDDI